jgi:hypothetical protein
MTMDFTPSDFDGQADPGAEIPQGSSTDQLKKDIISRLVMNTSEIMDSAEHYRLRDALIKFHGRISA